MRETVGVMSGQLDILVVVPTLEIGGAERAAMAQAECFSAAGYRVAALSLLRAPSGAAEVSAHVPVVRLDSPHGVRSVPRTAKVLRRFCKEKDVRLVVSHCAETSILCRVALALLPSTMHVEIAHSTHEVAGWQAMVAAGTRPLAGRQVAISQEVLNAGVSQRLLARDARVLGNIVTGSTASPRDVKAAWTEPCRAVLVVARFAPPKDQETLLRALRLYGDRRGDVGLVVHFVGEGPTLERVRHIAGQLNLSSLVRFHGAVADPWTVADAPYISVLPTRYEGRPLVIGEASLRGIPTLATAAPGVEMSEVHPLSTGMVVGDESALSWALESVLDASLNDYTEWCREARLQYEATYACAERKWLDCVAELIGPRSGC